MSSLIIVHDFKSRLTELPCTVSPRVAEVIASLGRTEDVRISPNNRRLAVAAFRRDRITLFDVQITMSSAGGAEVTLSGGIELASPALKRPHGVDFIDDDHIIVTSRAGSVAIFAVPPGNPEIPVLEVQPAQTWPAGGESVLSAPGSVAVAPIAADRREVLICNNEGDTVSRHLLDWRGGHATLTDSQVLVARWLDVPDGVAASGDGRWLAVSNHHTNSVLLYERHALLNADAEPCGILRRVFYAHGLRFSGDGRHLFVADAGAPYLHIYSQGADGWDGVHHPVSLRIMDAEQFRRGRHNAMEGGPKGLDIDRDGRVLVVTSECQPLAFFDLPSLLARARETPADPAIDLEYELLLMDRRRECKTKLREARSLLDYVRGSLSWRLTAPLRRLHTAWQSRSARKSDTVAARDDA